MKHGVQNISCDMITFSIPSTIKTPSIGEGIFISCDPWINDI